MHLPPRRVPYSSVEVSAAGALGKANTLSYSRLDSRSVVIREFLSSSDLFHSDELTEKELPLTVLTTLPSQVKLRAVMQKPVFSRL